MMRLAPSPAHRANIVPTVRPADSEHASAATSANQTIPVTAPKQVRAHTAARAKNRAQPALKANDANSANTQRGRPHELAL